MRKRPPRPDSPPAPARPIRAARYLRVSSQAQLYALGRQSAVIAAFAEAHGYEIVRTYQDAGRSGRTAKGRPGLRALLADVVGGAADYGAILVHDVSRWGRFENPDEAAHYEFVCRQEGVEVAYCAEPFGEFDAVSRAVLKQLKRVMAGEYSRHLGANVRAGQSRSAAKGYWAAGPPGYGLRRAAIRPDGRIDSILAPGVRPSVQGQRVRLVLGSPEEVAVVREIYRLFLDEGRSRTAIARELNAAGTPHTDGIPWSLHKVTAVLTNPIYAGDLAYGRTGRDPEGRYRRTPPEAWVVAADAIAPCVSREDQARARRRIEASCHMLDDDEMLRRLAELLARHGRLSTALIKAAEDLPAPVSYAKRFGALTRAYAAIGYHPKAAGGAAPSAPPEPQGEAAEHQEDDDR